MIARPAQASASHNPCCSSMKPSPRYVRKWDRPTMAQGRRCSIVAAQRGRGGEARSTGRWPARRGDVIQPPRASLPSRFHRSSDAMRLALTMLLAAAATAAPLAAGPALASDSVPEITRGDVAAQSVGVVHTLRQIPEACARIEGAFTGDPAEPYRYAVVRTSPNRQPRARSVAAAKARPDAAEGWILNDLLRMTSAECPMQQAVVRVWRKPVDQAIKLDGQGQSRIYVEEAKEAAAAGNIAAIPMFAAGMELEGQPCAG